jgi:hypothetical protein
MFKAFYDASVCSWLNQHPGVPLSMCDIAENVIIALQRTMTPSSILAGFWKAGIFRFDCSVFVDSDFLPCSITDRTDPTTATSESIATAGTPPDVSEISDTNSSEPLTSFASHLGVSEASTIASPELTSLESNGKATAVKFISPQQLKGYPSAGSRKNDKKGRAKGKTIIQLIYLKEMKLKSEQRKDQRR